ncbi:MAG: C-terminal binding protein [Anaerolineales bacterium]|nr:C-terminal binding protein [Anaerolineales bacterium]
MPPFRIVITDFSLPLTEIETAELEASGLRYELVQLNAKTAEELLPHMAEADALLVQWTPVTRPVIEALTKCRVISRYGIGVDMIDLEAAADHGIPVCNVPDYCIDEVSTHTLAFVLALDRHLLAHHQHVQGGPWGGAPGGAPLRLAGQTLGLVGLGRIGQAVARKAAGLGLKVMAFDPYLPADRAAALGVEGVSLADLLRRADYVSIHCPLTAETRHLIGAAELAQMKPSAYLINMARGPVVDQPALVAALTNGTLAGAAVDVLEKEPPAADEPLLRLPNLLVTPHTSSWSAESLVQLRQGVVQNVIRVLKGEPPRAVVNPRVLGNLRQK